MGISRTHAARMNLVRGLEQLTRISFPVYLQLGNQDQGPGQLEVVAPIGIISASSYHGAATELANLLRAVADDIDPSVVTVVREDTETATHGRPVENVDLLDKTLRDQ